MTIENYGKKTADIPEALKTPLIFELSAEKTNSLFLGCLQEKIKKTKNIRI